MNVSSIICADYILSYIGMFVSGMSQFNASAGIN